MTKKLLVIDTETTNLTPEGDNGIVSIGVVDLDIKKREYEVIFNSYCDLGWSKERLEKTWLISKGYATFYSSQIILREVILMMNYETRPAFEKQAEMVKELLKADRELLKWV